MECMNFNHIISKNGLKSSMWEFFVLSIGIGEQSSSNTDAVRTLGTETRAALRLLVGVAFLFSITLML